MSEISDKIISQMFPEYSDMDEEERTDFRDDMSVDDSYEVNKRITLETGKKEYDYLICNEIGRLDEKEYITDYETLYDFDKKWWEFQRDAIKDSVNEQIEQCKKDKSYAEKMAGSVTASLNNIEERFGKGYEMYCTGDWIRLIDNGVFKYAQIISLKNYIFYELENYADEIEENLIPYDFGMSDFIQSLNENDPRKMYDANGREFELESFKKKLMQYQADFFTNIISDYLDKHYKHLSGKTLFEEDGYESDDFDPFTNYIFFDEESLKKVRPKHFLKDFKAIQIENSSDIISQIIEELKLVVKRDIEKIFEENRKDFE